MIEVCNVSFTYPGGSRPAVRDASFAIGQGEIFGCLGPSGAGKSTMQKVLTRLLDGYQGTIRVLGRELSAWRHDYFEHVGVSFELPNHYQKLTALENLDFFRSLYRGRTADPHQLLERLGLADAADTRVAHFSKGMQMRLTVARALLNCPKLLFLDEPTSGLDPVNARAVQALIREQQQAGCTIFLTTHAMAVAEELCDRVAFVVDGQIVLIDSPRALRLRHGQRQVRVEYQEASQTLVRDFPLDDLAADDEFQALLRDRAIETLHSREASLEDIFVQVTGRSLQ